MIEVCHSNAAACKTSTHPKVFVDDKHKVTCLMQFGCGNKSRHPRPDDQDEVLMREVLHGTLSSPQRYRLSSRSRNVCVSCMICFRRTEPMRASVR